jgi:hypothetical protein
VTATLSEVMDGLAALVTTVPNVYAWPVESVTVPCVLVDFPTLDFDQTMGRGADEWVVPLLYLTGKTGTKDYRDALSDIIPVLKAALDGTHTFGDVRVTTASVTTVTVGAVAYPAVKFDCEVIG